MRKIPTMFLRDWDNPRHITREPNPDCAWVFDGEGIVTVKWDGTCMMLDDDGQWWARREVRPGKAHPPNFLLIEEDEKTGKAYGWEPIEQSSFAKCHAEAIAVSGHEFAPGTYELVGPKVNGNPDKFAGHVLMRHGWAPLSLREDAKSAPRDYDGLAVWLGERHIEGLVWHHPDGHMAKIKRRDFPTGGAS
ncbi:hypothetical protein C1I98_28560 [Spongiactinospora gelatinilytica]|uniref:Uncharacterized protein n=1 Tax=Spongiactinospora gelatinilytica TaxID=2666298 RepID=A0A2W2FDL2_9ACTN|nr:DUF5565 family protein [Spongiactinospora gelatinilytica]PZG33713.1 hypothetical protein C1I98_28560 [Spongiactinospora gelatinilytica]